MGKYLKFYKDCMKTGVLPKNGLCHSIGKRAVKMFTPSSYEYWGHDNGEDPSDYYWGYAAGDYEIYWPYDIDKISMSFSPMRQNVVLLLAAMAGELNRKRK